MKTFSDRINGLAEPIRDRPAQFLFLVGPPDDLPFVLRERLKALTQRGEAVPVDLAAWRLVEPLKLIGNRLDRPLTIGGV